MKTTKQLLGARIKELRKKRGLTQDQLAEMVDLAPRYVSLIEVGKGSPSLETIENVSRALAVDLKTLFDFMHLDDDAVSAGNLEKDLSELAEGNRRLIYRIVNLMQE